MNLKQSPMVKLYILLMCVIDVIEEFMEANNSSKLLKNILAQSRVLLLNIEKLDKKVYNNTTKTTSMLGADMSTNFMNKIDEFTFDELEQFNN